MGHQTTTSLSYGFILSKEDLAKLYHVLEQYSQSQSKSAPPGDVQITPKETQKLHLGHIQNLMDMVSKFLNEHNDENFYPGDFLLKTSYDEYEESESLDRAAILYTGEYPSIMETQEGRAGYCLEVWGNEHGVPQYPHDSHTTLKKQRWLLATGDA